MTWEGAIYEFIDKANRFYRYMESVGVPIRFHEFYRDFNRQDQLYREGKTKARAGESAHNYALAADFHFKDYGWDVPDNWWAFADRVARFFGLTTGINYNDANHLEYPQWKTYKSVSYS